MKICCSVCGKAVSGEIRYTPIIRAFIACPECIEKRTDDLRDDFAGDALTRLAGSVETKNGKDTTFAGIATECYRYADAMLEARKK